MAAWRDVVRQRGRTVGSLNSVYGRKCAIFHTGSFLLTSFKCPPRGEVFSRKLKCFLHIEGLEWINKRRWLLECLTNPPLSFVS